LAAESLMMTTTTMTCW